MADPIVVRYIGGSEGRYLIGIPTRDLTASEVVGLGLTVDQLVARDGVYAPVEGAAAADHASASASARTRRRASAEPHPDREEA